MNINNENAKLITCIVSKNEALPLVSALNEKGYKRVNVNYARRMEAESHNRLFSGDEVEILTVIVKQEQAEEVFHYIYDYLEIDLKPGTGFMYQTDLKSSSPFNLPEISASSEVEN